MHLTPCRREDHGVTPIVVGGRAVAIEGGADSGRAQASGKVEILALIEPSTAIPLHSIGYLGLEQNEPTSDVHVIVGFIVIQQYMTAGAAVGGPIPEAGSIRVENAHRQGFPIVSEALQAGVKILMEEEIVVDHHEVVIARRSGQCVAHLPEASVAGGVHGENCADSLRQMTGRFAAHQDFELRNLERADGFDLTSQFPGAFAVGNDEEGPTGFALSNLDLLGRTDR